MLTLLAIALLSSPLPAVEPACDEFGWPVASVAVCRASCSWWDRHDERCRDTDVEVIGSWDPRPAPADWSGFSLSPPPAYGAFPLEKNSP
jgi:hypothetical protein